MTDIQQKFEALSEHLSSVGWTADQAIVTVLDGDDDEDRKKGFLGKAFFLEVYSFLRERLCKKEGGVKPAVERGATLLGICAEAIETITDAKVNASLLMDIVVSIGLERFCMK